MSLKEEIRNYGSKEEVEADYERYKEEWRYNVEDESGVHKTGIGLRKVYFGDGLKMEYRGYDEWCEKMRSEGLTDDETRAYLRMLKNQFIVMNEKNPYIEREPTEEERRADLEDWRKRHIAFMIKCARLNHRSEEEIEQSIREYNQFFDRYHYGKDNGGR